MRKFRKHQKQPILVFTSQEKEKKGNSKSKSHNQIELLTSLLKAAVAVWRSAGSIARRVSINGSDEDGKSLNVSAMHLLYDCWGLNMVACGSFNFFQYSSEGEPHNLNILCSCSTYMT